MTLYKAVVEDNNDPLKLGRVKIRVLGVHTHELSQVPTDDLPWANVDHPITSSANSGVGQWSVPVKGSWVRCFPEDEDLQRWVVFSAISGVPQEVANTSIGFNDPSGEYPLSDRVPEPDMNRLAANRDVDKTIIPIKVEEVVKNIKIASLIIRGTDINSFVKATDQGQKYTEPQEPYSAEYPYNKVTETEPKDFISGHIVEMDDTPGKERVHVWHKSGTFISVHPNGQSVTKVVHDNYEMNMRNKYEFVNNSRFITIWGDDRSIVKKSKQTEIYGREAMYVKGNSIKYISGDFALHVGSELVDDPEDPDWILKSKKKDSSGSSEVEATSPEYTEIGGNANILVEGGVHRVTGANEHITVKGSYYCRVTGTRSNTKNLVGKKGCYTIEPEDEFLVKGHKMSRIWGNQIILDKGCVNGYSICPFIMQFHMHKSFSVRSSF